MQTPVLHYLLRSPAAHTLLPVLGVPIESSPLQGLDALLATVQMLLLSDKELSESMQERLRQVEANAKRIAGDALAVLGPDAIAALPFVTRVQPVAWSRRPEIRNARPAGSADATPARAETLQLEVGGYFNAFLVAVMNGVAHLGEQLQACARAELLPPCVFGDRSRAGDVLPVDC